MKRSITFVLIFFGIVAHSTYAQIEIGGTYEIRNEEPTNGFGAIVQVGLYEPMPFVNFGVRAHASFFDENNNVSEDEFTYKADFSNYDVGAGVFGSISLGIISPYAGVGLGTQNYKAVTENYDGPDDLNPAGEESNVYWNLFTGAKFKPIPLFKPFIEYRYTNKDVSAPNFQEVQDARIVFGVVLSF